MTSTRPAEAEHVAFDDQILATRGNTRSALATYAYYDDHLQCLKIRLEENIALVKTTLSRRNTMRVWAERYLTRERHREDTLDQLEQFKNALQLCRDALIKNLENMVQAYNQFKGILEMKMILKKNDQERIRTAYRRAILSDKTIHHVIAASEDATKSLQNLIKEIRLANTAAGKQQKVAPAAVVRRKQSRKNKKVQLSKLFRISEESNTEMEMAEPPRQSSTTRPVNPYPLPKNQYPSSPLRLFDNSLHHAETFSQQAKGSHARARSATIPLDKTLKFK